MAADLEHDLPGDDLADLPQFLHLDAGVNRVQQLADEVEVGRGTDKHFLRPTGDGMHNEVLVGVFTEAREVAAVEVLDVAAILVEMVGRWHTASIDLLNWFGPRFCFRRERHYCFSSGAAVPLAAVHEQRDTARAMSQTNVLLAHEVIDAVERR